MKTIFTEVLEIKNNYEFGTIDIIEGLSWSQYHTIKMIEFYTNSRYVDGMKDELGREKPFYNIVNANVDTSVAATDVDFKDITVQATNADSYDKAMILNRLVQSWMRETNFSKTLNEIGEVLPRYGGVIVKKREYDGKLNIDVVQWKNIMTDPIDIDGGTKIEKHWMTPVQLSKKRGVWRNVEKAIELCDRKQLADAPRGTVCVYEIEGNLPKSFITKNPEDQYDYVMQCWYIIATGNYMIDLYDEEVKESKYKYHPWKKVSGRGLGWGVVEDGEQAQIWTNDSVIQEQATMELAGKVIVQTASKKYSGRNILTEIDQGTVLEHDENRPFTRVDLTPSSLPVWQNLVSRWQNQYDRSSAITDALRGETPPSGQAYRLQALITQASASQFDYRREAKGIFISELIQDWVIPYLIKKFNSGGEYAVQFTKEELDAIDEQIIGKEAAKKLEKIRNQGTGFVDPAQVEQAMNEAMQKMAKTGDTRYLKLPEGFFKGIKTKVTVDITGEQKNKMAQLESLANIFNQIQMTYNPNTGQFAALEDPVLSEIFYKIVEGSGIDISPITLASKVRAKNPPAQPQMPEGAPAPAPQPGGAEQYQSVLPGPEEILPAATTQ